MIWQGWEASANLVIDAIDMKNMNTIGLFGIRMDLSKGLVEDRQISCLTRSPLSETAQRFLRTNSYDPDLVFKRGQELTFEVTPWNEVAWVNLKVEPAYRDKGDQEFKGIAQILLTTALRLAAEQFFCIAYLMETSQWHSHYFNRILGAQNSIKHPTYAGHYIMTCSFIGEPGFGYVDAILDQRHEDAMTDWD